jgi:SAM-dependent methyltransferase
MATRRQDSDFYEQLAPVYHLKVDWDKRLPKETPLFDRLFADANISAVCDLGCGDGGHAKEIVRRGATYVGIDNSAEMIKKAKAGHARVRGIRFLTGDMLRMPMKYDRMFDLVLLLGNTLPHIATAGELSVFFRSVGRVLKPGGKFVIQTVNPEMLKAKLVHFLPPKLADGRILFAPFYVRQREHWDFLMPIYVVESGSIVSHKVLKTALRFWTLSQIVAAAKGKLKVTAAFGDARLSPYVKGKSENLIMIMEKI